MIQNTTYDITYYQKLGELFYAIAAADKHVHKAEYATLRKLVAENWKPIDTQTDEFGSDAASQIEIVFDWFDYEQMDARECFNDFAEYKKEHETFFPPHRNQLIMKTATAIANAFAGTNKAEQAMLAKLHLILSWSL